MAGRRFTFIQKNMITNYRKPSVVGVYLMYQKLPTNVGKQSDPSGRTGADCQLPDFYPALPANVLLFMVGRL